MNRNLSRDFTDDPVLNERAGIFPMNRNLSWDFTIENNGPKFVMVNYNPSLKHNISQSPMDPVGGVAPRVLSRLEESAGDSMYLA